MGTAFTPCSPNSEKQAGGQAGRSCALGGPRLEAAPRQGQETAASCRQLRQGLCLCWFE